MGWESMERKDERSEKLYFRTDAQLRPIAQKGWQIHPNVATDGKGLRLERKIHERSQRELNKYRCVPHELRL